MFSYHLRLTDLRQARGRLGAVFLRGYAASLQRQARLTQTPCQADIFFYMADEDLKDLINNTQELIRHHREVADKAEEMLKRFLELEKRTKENEGDKK